MPDLEIIYSPLSGEFSREGITVMIEIHRLSDTEGWALEVTHQGSPTLWNEEFNTDQAAFRSFIETVEKEGSQAVVSSTA
jgi:hypothetical protein